MSRAKRFGRRVITPFENHPPELATSSRGYRTWGITKNTSSGTGASGRLSVDGWRIARNSFKESQALTPSEPVGTLSGPMPYLVGIVMAEQG